MINNLINNDYQAIYALMFSVGYYYQHQKLSVLSVEGFPNYIASLLLITLKIINMKFRHFTEHSL